MLIIFLCFFVVEIDGKSSHNGEFKYDLMMVIYSGLLFWATLYSVRLMEKKSRLSSWKNSQLN